LKDVTVLPDTTVIGGVLSGEIDNQGTLRNVRIRVNTIVKGGTLEGVIHNGGLLQNATLAKGTLIQGGSLAGTVTGNLDNPALIKNAQVLANTVLKNVIIGNGTHLAEGVSISDGVHFEKDDANQ